MNDYCCTYGHSIEYRDREFYFREGLCGLCYCALIERAKSRRLYLHVAVRFLSAANGGCTVFDRGGGGGTLEYGARQKYGRRAAAVKYFILLHHRLARRLWCQWPSKLSRDSRASGRD